MIAFRPGDFAKTSQVAFLPAELGRQESLNQIPGRVWTNDATAETKDVHVVIRDSLSRRKMVHHQSCARTTNFVGRNRHSHSAPTNGYAALQITCGNGPCQRDYKVGIIVCRFQPVSTKVDNFMARPLETCQ